MMRKRCFVLVVGVLLLLSACSPNKGPAEQAIKTAQSAYDAIKGDALRYVPDKSHAVEETLAAARTSFDKGDYDMALSAANSVIPAVNDLTAVTAVKKVELTRTWGDLSNGVPKLVGAIQSRVNYLSKSKALPAGLDPTALEGARSGLADLTKMWTDATAAYQSGNITSAVATATMAKNQAVQIMSTLGMPIPSAAGN
jgi:hypothetical protein